MNTPHRACVRTKWGRVPCGYLSLAFTEGLEEAQRQKTERAQYSPKPPRYVCASQIRNAQRTSMVIMIV